MTVEQRNAFRQLPGMEEIAELNGGELLVRLHRERLFVLERNGLLRPFHAANAQRVTGVHA